VPSIAYLDPPHSRYFHRLAARLAQRSGSDVVALLSSPAYRTYTAGDRAEVWPPGRSQDVSPLPTGSTHAVWSQTDNDEFRAVFWHAVDWLYEQFRAHDVVLCMIFSDARPFSLAAELAARRLGVQCVWFERGAFRYSTVSISTSGLNARFCLDKARRNEAITGVSADEDLRRRPLERGLKRHFVRFALSNGWARWREPQRTLLQHKRYALSLYLRLQWTQWCSMRPRLGRERLPAPEPGAPLVVLPLQTPEDSQWRLYSPFESVQNFIDFVAAEVRRVAPGARLLVKRHPMDAHRYAMPAGAVQVVGNLARFYKDNPIVVVVNSTVGFEAAVRGMRVICFGPSFYTDGDVVALVTPQSFAGVLAERLQRPRDRDEGHALRDAVLRWYQAPGDAWAFTKNDLDRTAQIIEQHCGVVSSLAGAGGRASA